MRAKETHLEHGGTTGCATTGPRISSVVTSVQTFQNLSADAQSNDRSNRQDFQCGLYVCSFLHRFAI